jgi:diguanylate cyclase (GGDEF)-like protein
VQLDPTTLIVINVANLLAMSLTLPLVMGRHLSPAARDARRALIVNGVAWIALIGSGFWIGQWPDWLLSSVAMGLLSISNWLVFRALAGWLGPRPLGTTLLVLVAAMPLGYAMSFGSYPVRVGWANLLTAGQLLILARATLWPRKPDFGRRTWRLLMLTCFLLMAGFTAARGVLGAWFTELYPYFRAPTPVNIGALIAANLTLVLGNIAVLAAWREEADQALHTYTQTDALTGLLNRKGWEEHARRALRRTQRLGQPVSLLMFDVDHLRLVNDRYGRDGGDAALRLFGKLIQRCLRPGDVGARVGGEEFCVLLAPADTDAAYTFDRRLRAQLAHAAPTTLGFDLDFSSGQALRESGEEPLDTLMARADAALDHAKHGGRGHLVSDDPLGVTRPLLLEAEFAGVEVTRP